MIYPELDINGMKTETDVCKHIKKMVKQNIK